MRNSTGELVISGLRLMIMNKCKECRLIFPGTIINGDDAGALPPFS